MKTTHFNLILILITITLLFSSCEKEPPNVIEDTRTLEVDSINVINIDLTVNELYQYDSDRGGDEEGAGIFTQASHFNISEIIRNESTDFVPIYTYQPEVDYVGQDEVELELSRQILYVDSFSVEREYLKLIFTISE